MVNASQAVLIGIDQGTTNTKALAVTADGNVLATASRPLASVAPRPGWLEQDAEAMLRGVCECVGELLRDPALTVLEIAGIGIANQTETLVVWDEQTGAPLLPAIIWQCRRGDAELAALHAAGVGATLRQRCGLDLDPTFTAAKLRWLIHHRPAIASRLRDGSALFGTVDCWLMWKLSGGAVYATDASNASRTALFDIHTLAWADDLFDVFELPIPRRPEVRRSSGPFGNTAGEVLGATLPMTGALGDQQASLLGHGCVAPGQLKITYGTGAFLWLNAGASPDFEVAEGLLRTVAWQLDEPCYAVEGFIMQAGAVLDWVAQRLSLDGSGAAVAALAEQAGEAGGVMLVPAFQGLAAPWWSPTARAALFGLSEASDNGHLCHAALESICYQVRALLEALARSTGEVTMIRADGGPTRSAYLMRLQADIGGTLLAVAPIEATSAYGAALMAGLGAGLWPDLAAVGRLVDQRQPVVFSPVVGQERGYQAWRAAVDAVLALHRQLEAPATGMSEAGEPLDLFVVGGGINGAAIACDAAGRGLSVAVADMQDFAEGTSSRSSKLIHGGLRYLESFDFKLVRDALREREILMAKAPHLVWPLRLVLPVVSGQRSRWMIRLGLYFYDYLAARRVLQASEGIDLRKHVAGAPLKPGFRHAFAYSDCRGDDSRLVIANLLGAERHGAEILPRHRVTALLRSAGTWRVTLHDLVTGATTERCCRALVNAAGPWVMEVGKLHAATTRRRLRLVKGSHLVVPRQWPGEFGYFLQTGDGRLMEAFPYEEEFTSIGTTDEPWDAPPEQVSVAEHEVDYMLAEVNGFLRQPLRREDVVHSYAGVRPLFEVGGARDGSLSTLTRDYAFEVEHEQGAAPVLSIFGGKLTTHRRLAEAAMTQLAPFLRPARPGRSATEPLPGGDFDTGGVSGFESTLRETHPWLPPALMRRYTRTYGTRTTALLRDARCLDDLGVELGGGLRERELEFLVATEWARSAEDVLWRRTKLGLHLDATQVSAVRVAMAALVAASKGEWRTP